MKFFFHNYYEKIFMILVLYFLEVKFYYIIFGKENSEYVA